MNRFYTAALCLLLAAGCGDSGTKGDTKDGEIVGTEATFLSNFRLIPGDGSPPIENATMILNKDKIYQIGKEKELKPPKGSLQLDMDSHTILPMLINLNAYPGLNNAGTFGAKNYKRDSLTTDLNRYEYYGVTAIVAGGDSDGLAFQVRDEQKQGKATGAQLYTSGRGIAAKGGSGDMGDIPDLVSSAADARKAVSELADRKADIIVLWANDMKADTAAAVIDEAHKHKLKVFADAPGLAEAKGVVKAGVDALIASVRDSEIDNELVSLMKEKKISYAPALSSLQSQFVYTEKPKWLGESLMREVYPAGLSAYLEDPVFVARIKRRAESSNARQQYMTASKNLKKLADGGVTIAFGSGSGLYGTFPGYFEHLELELMVDAGLSTAEVIKAATASSASALGASDLGVLAPGKKANFTIVTDNPLDKISNTKGIDEVYINGKQVDRQELKRNIHNELPQITKGERDAEATLAAKEAEAAAEAKLQHYGNGKFVLGSSLNVGAGLIVPTPKHAKTSATPGPPYRVTIAFPGAAGADLQAFYKETLKGWSVSGTCWERPVPGEDTKKFRACPEASAGQIILNITKQ